MEVPVVGEVVPIRVRAFDEGELPVAHPFLDAAFATDGCEHGLVRFEPDQVSAAVLGAEAFIAVRLMLPDAGVEVRRRARIEGTVSTAGHDVDSDEGAARVHIAKLYAIHPSVILRRSEAETGGASGTREREAF